MTTKVEGVRATRVRLIQPHSPWLVWLGGSPAGDSPNDKEQNDGANEGNDNAADI